MRKKISVKLLSLVGALIFVGVFSNLLSLFSVKSIEEKSNVITEQCLTAVNLLSETSRGVERVQRFAKDTSEGNENDDMQQEDNGLTELFTQLEEIVAGFQDESMSQALDDYQTAYSEYTSQFSNMGQGEAGVLEKDDSATTSMNEMQNKQSDMEQYSLALDMAYTNLHTLIQDKVNQATDKMQNQTSKTESMNVVMSIVMIGFGVIIVLITISTIIYPLKSAKRQIEEMIAGIVNKQGDLTARINIRNKDELGALVNGINQFIDHLQKTMDKVKQESDKLGISADVIIEQVELSTENVMNVSAITEELSSSMEEVTSTAEEFGEGISNVTYSAGEINKQVVNGHQLSNEIKERSNVYQSDVLQGKENTTKIIHVMRSGLAKSIEESKSVEKIRVLTEEILEIASQTNLLALNASIEAARAGAAGAGFTVVAEQIRNLADSSRSTANNIQEISKLVMSGVSSLSTDSTKMIEYLDDSILKDYDKFVDITTQYNNDAESVNDMIGQVATNASTLVETMNQMQIGVNEIVTTINESTKGITDVAVSASDLVSSMEQLKCQADSNQESGKGLMEEVNVFKKIMD